MLVLGANASSGSDNGLKGNIPVALNPLFMFARITDFSHVGVKRSAKFNLEISCSSLYVGK